MASPQSAYVTAVPDDYDVEQATSPTNSEASASPPLNWDLDAFNWPEINSNSPYTMTSSSPQSTTPIRQSSLDSASTTSQNSHSQSHSPSMSQKWQQIITSNACPQSLTENQNSLDEITKELSQRDQMDARMNQARSQQAYDEEQRRRLAWAMEMILTRPEESGEVCAALRKAR